MAEDRRDEILGFLNSALDGLSGLSDDDREAAPDALDSLAHHIRYGQAVIEQTDPDLVLPDTWDELASVLTNIDEQSSSNPAALVQQASAYRATVSQAVTKMPVAQGRLDEQRLAELLTDADKRIQEQIDALKDRIAQQETRETRLEEQLAEKETELQQYVTERKAEVDTALTEATGKVTEAQANIENALTSHTEDFRRAQEERAEKFNEASEARETKLTELAEDAESRTRSVVEAAEAAMAKATSAEGALGVKGTAERYNDEAEDQKRAANIWRFATVGIVVLAVAAALWAASAEEGNTSLLVGRLAIGVALGALATYTARQSSRHRDREEDLREIALDLAAFNSFIEPLSSDDDKDEERQALGKRVFGQQRAAMGRKDHPGPGLVDQVTDQVLERLRGLTGKGEPPPSDPGSSG